METHVGSVGQCSICLESLDTKGFGRQWLPCGHAMHELCITELRRRGASGRCPLCRESHADLTPLQVLLDRALEHYQRKEFEEAVGLFEEALSVDPSNAPASYGFGCCFLDGQGVDRNLGRAMNLFEVARRGGIIDGVFAIGCIYREQGDLLKAMELFEEARRGGSMTAACRLGVVFFRQGDEQKSREAFEEARRGADVHAAANAAFNLGSLDWQRGDLHKARELLEEACRAGEPNAAHALDMVRQQQQQAYRSRKGSQRSNLSIPSQDVAVGGVSAARTQSPNRFRRGDMVRINGLQSATGRCLNGRVGTVVKLRSSTGRFGVQVSGSDDPKSIHAKNLMMIDRDDPAAAFEQLAGPDRPFEIDDVVRILGLTSSAAPFLNGRRGQIVSFDESTGRFGVQVHGRPGLKAVRPLNLRHVSSAQPEAAASIEELAAQFAIEETMVEARVANDVDNANAQVSDDLLRSTPADSGPRVLLLKFDKPKLAMRDVLLNAKELAPCRAALEEQKLQVELGSKALIFVRPEHHGPAIVASRLQGWTLHKNHVLVDIDLEDTVMQLVAQLRGRSFVYLKSRGVLPLGLAESAPAWGNLGVMRTFIQICVPNSMRSESDPEAARTVSTTDADPRKRGSARAARRGANSGAGP